MVVALLVAGAWAGLTLRLETELLPLLPDGLPSVRGLAEFQRRFASEREVFVVADPALPETARAAAMQKLCPALAALAALAALPGVASVAARGAHLYHAGHADGTCISPQTKLPNRRSWSTGSPASREAARSMANSATQSLASAGSTSNNWTRQVRLSYEGVT